MLKCNRCDHEWKQKFEIKPSICPRCKSKIWDSNKDAHKCGYLYVVYLKDSKVAVGQTINPNKRFEKYPFKIEAIATDFPLHDLNKKERELIRFTKSVCGNPIKGRELFSGEESDFIKIKSYLGKIQCDKKIDMENESKDTFDLLRVSCKWSLEANIPRIKHQLESSICDLTHISLAVYEALSDYKAGICSAEYAFDSLISMLSGIIIERRQEMRGLTVESLEKKHDIIINDICSESTNRIARTKTLAK